MQIIKKTDVEYPDYLRNIKNPPEKLYVEGNASLLKASSITVVGSRNMTEYGMNVTKKIVKDLTKEGICIVSGMAIGIDSVAHRTCLENGGHTIAVLGSGLHRVFPPENKGLFKEIVNSGGCVVSEYPPDVYAQKRFFVERNRIVSGLSIATLVIEATHRSGTSITANCAVNQGKKLFCIPNSIGNKNSAGIINWLKKGAIVVTSASDILKELGMKSKCKQLSGGKIKEFETEKLNGMDERLIKIYYYIKENICVNSELLCDEIGMEINELNSCLTMLELRGLIVNVSGQNFKISDDMYE